MSEFFYMDGYGAYVWSAYAIAMLILSANLVLPVVQNRKLRKRLLRIHQQDST